MRVVPAVLSAVVLWGLVGCSGNDSGPQSLQEKAAAQNKTQQAAQDEELQQQKDSQAAVKAAKKK